MEKIRRQAHAETLWAAYVQLETKGKLWNPSRLNADADKAALHATLVDEWAQAQSIAADALTFDLGQKHASYQRIKWTAPDIIDERSF